MKSEATRRRIQKPQLKVVLETNILYSGTASDLVQQEAANLIKESVYPDLEILWYLPDIVRHERQYQMRKRALELLPPVAKVERLLGHNLAITEEILLDAVEKSVSLRREELGLLSLALDNSKVDWNRVGLDAVYRRPPFQDGEKEKGFRDCMILESFLQLVADSPKAASACRIVLLTGDKLLNQAVQARNTGWTNISVLASLDELRGLINTLVSEVDEEFLALLRPKAGDLFFEKDERSTLLYKEEIVKKLKEKFAAELADVPPGATTRTNGTWTVNPPNFVKKTGRRIQWASRISIEAEASKPATQPRAAEAAVFSPVTAGAGFLNTYISAKGTISNLHPEQNAAVWLPNSGIASIQPNLQAQDLWTVGTMTPTITTHKGTDVYEVLWSADVTTSHDLRRPSIDELKHLEPVWEQVT
jgi:hypothetical protein